MSLIVENGSGLANAESYISVADADTYHAGIGSASWAALTVTEKEQALRRSTAYMAVYRPKWAGTRATVTQALDWPRYLVPIKDAPGVNGLGVSYYPFDIVPSAVAFACADLALRASTTDLAPDIEPSITMEKVGPIETEYDADSIAYTQYRQVDNILAPFLKLTGSMISITR